MKHTQLYQGLHTALITPFLNEKIDFHSLEVLIQRQIEAGVQGITLLGSTGEGATISFHERQKLLQFARKLIPQTVAFIGGCGTSNTIDTVQQIQIAEEARVDAHQIVTPPYNRPTQEGLYRHYEALYQSSTRDILIYNIPGRTACSLTKETVNKLFELDRIRGIKEGSENLSFTMDLITIANNKKTILCGDDLLALPYMSLGAHGLVSVISNLFPKTVVELIGYLKQGEYEKARKIHYLLKPFIQTCFVETNPAPIKYMLSKITTVKNTLRLPLVPISQESAQKIDSLFTTINPTTSLQEIL